MLAAGAGSPLRAEVDAEVLAAQASAALHRAVAFYREQVATEGSYLWKYSTDLTVRRGEGDATPSQGWVQPPGTPAIGLAYIDAWVATGDEYILAAAVETARGAGQDAAGLGRLVPLDRVRPAGAARLVLSPAALRLRGERRGRAAGEREGRVP